MQLTDLSFSAVVGQGWKSASAPEFGAANDDWRRGRLRYKQVSRVCVAHLWGKKKKKHIRTQWYQDHMRRFKKHHLHMQESAG